MKKKLRNFMFLMMAMLFVAGIKTEAAEVGRLQIGNEWVVMNNEVKNTNPCAGVSYDRNTNTLTLTNANMADIFYSGSEDLNIVVSGNNILNANKSYGIFLVANYDGAGNVNIRGTGSITVKNGAGFLGQQASNDKNDGDILVDGVTIYAEGSGIVSNYSNVTVRNAKLYVNNKKIDSQHTTFGITAGRCTWNEAYEGMLTIENSELELKNCTTPLACNNWKITGSNIYSGNGKAEYQVASGKLFEYDKYGTARRYYNDSNYIKITTAKLDLKPRDIKVSKMKVSTSSKMIAAGKKVALKVAVAPSNATNKAVTWSSSNKKYATVDSRGVVTTKKAGAGKTVTITATAKDGSKKRASVKIKIMKGQVKKISLKADKTVKAGKSLKIKTTVSASKGANKTLVYSSSNTKYATVSSKGVVKASKAAKGKTVKITAKATDGSGKSASVKIKIK